MSYLMENSEEHVRLGIKTSPQDVIRQATWAGIKPGMRILDVGCGSGVATAVLSELVGENGSVTGIDFSEERIELARRLYGGPRVKFFCHDIRKPYVDECGYDVIWARFILEYFKNDQYQVVSNCVESLRKGGIACLVDLDNNSLCHQGHSDRLQRTLVDIMMHLERDFNFDPYAGRRLYGHLNGLGFKYINCMIEAHHLIYGNLSDKDAYNWIKKIEVAAEKSGCKFEEYVDDFCSDRAACFERFLSEFKEYFRSHNRFCYTPLIICSGIKP